MEIKIHCKYDKLEKLSDLKEHPKNRNKHGNDQIERLAHLYKAHGVRHPIIVSKLSGLICAGHGRRLGAIRAGMKEFPVVYQDFESAQAEYAFLQSDNSIALWADLDIKGIGEDILDFGPEFNFDDLGIKNFVLDFSEKGFDPSDDENDESEKSKNKQCPHCGGDI